MNALSLLVLVVLAAMAHTTAAERTVYDLNEADTLFEKFIKDYNREYKDAADRELHFNAFKKNLEAINTHNKASSHATFGINKFADYTDDEKKSMRGLKSN